MTKAMRTIDKLKRAWRYFLFGWRTADDKNVDVEYTLGQFHRLRDQLIQTLGNEGYGARLDEIEPDLSMAYKEADYQIVRADYLDAELQYYKAANNPAGPSANMLKTMWDRRCELKERLDAFEVELQQQNMQ